MSMVHASRGAAEAGIGRALIGTGDHRRHRQATLPHTRVDWDWLVADYDRIRDKIEGVFPDFFDFNARIAQAGRLPPARRRLEREWQTPTSKANFLVFTGSRRIRAGPRTTRADPDHDAQPRSVQHHHLRPERSLSRHHRRRDVVFVNADDLAGAGPRAWRPGGRWRGGRPGASCRGQTAVAHPDRAADRSQPIIPRRTACLALDDYDARSGTPSYKSLPVMLRAPPEAEPAVDKLVMEALL